MVAAVGVLTILFKGSGPLFLGSRPLPPRVRSVVDLLAPVMLMALVVTQTFASGRELSVDARLPGVAAAAIALALRPGLPVLAAMAIGGAVAAGVRLL